MHSEWKGSERDGDGRCSRDGCSFGGSCGSEPIVPHHIGESLREPAVLDRGFDSHPRNPAIGTHPEGNSEGLAPHFFGIIEGGKDHLAWLRWGRPPRSCAHTPTSSRSTPGADSTTIPWAGPAAASTTTPGSPPTTITAGGHAVGRQRVGRGGLEHRFDRIRYREDLRGRDGYDRRRNGYHDGHRCRPLERGECNHGDGSPTATPSTTTLRRPGIEDFLPPPDVSPPGEEERSDHRSVEQDREEGTPR